MKFEERLARYIKAGYTGLLIESPEEQRVEDEVFKAAKRFKGVRVLVWSVTRGIMQERDGNLKTLTEADPLEVFPAIMSQGEDLIVIMRDAHHYFDDPIVSRHARDALAWAKMNRCTFIFVSPTCKLPSDLEADIHRVDFALPDAEALAEVLDALIEVNKKKVSRETKEVAVEAARGLTTVEAENVFSLALGNGGTLDPLTISKEKAQAIKRSGTLELYESEEVMENVGGQDCLKAWLGARERAFSKEARSFGLPEPRGIMLIGVPGSGKSLVAKAVAAAWRKPLLRFDVGAVFGSLVGESEASMRKAIQTAEAVSPCILWIDEVIA